MEPDTQKAIVFVSSNLQRLHKLIAGTRSQLAELEAKYTSERHSVLSLQAKIFYRLRAYYKKRDRLRLLIKYHKKVLDALLHNELAHAERVETEHRQADRDVRQEYEKTEASMALKQPLSDDDEAELKILWRQLVKLFHPDRFADDAPRQDTYTKLTAAINTAKDKGDMETLRQIANDPNGYIRRQGWVGIDLTDNDEMSQLQKLLKSLEDEVIAITRLICDFRESSLYKLYQIIQNEPEALEEIVALQIERIDEELAKLRLEADYLKDRIIQLGGKTVISPDCFDAS